jgi:hypothetical protein
MMYCKNQPHPALSTLERVLIFLLQGGKGARMRFVREQYSMFVTKQA